MNTVKAIKMALQEFRTGSEISDPVYQTTMLRIEGYDIIDDAAFAKLVLSWITYAERPLTTLELRHALAVEVGQSYLDKENMVSDDQMSCAGLIVVDREYGIVRFAHHTIQQYFQRTGIDWFPNAKSDIAKVCITYLSFDTFETGFCSTEEDFQARLQLNPLYDYAARNWGHHARTASEDVEPFVMNFLRSNTKVSAACQALLAPISGGSQKAPRQTTGIHLAAYFGLQWVVPILLDESENRNSRDSYGDTPLSWATRSGHYTGVKLLLERGANPDSTNNEGQTPLLLAAEQGHEAIARLLLDYGANLESKDNEGQTPLLLAVKEGHEATVGLLLIHSANLESTDSWGHTPLLVAIKEGHEAITRLLLDKGAQLESTDHKGQTPLCVAAKVGDEGIARLLLDKSAHLESTDNKGQTPLFAAVGDEAIAKLLLQTGARSDAKDNKGQTPLFVAAKMGYQGIVKILLDFNADPKSTDNKGQTPVSVAAGKGHDDIARLLLTQGR